MGTQTSIGAAQAAALAGSLRPAVLRLARRLRQMHDESHGLSHTQLGVLGALFRDSPMSIGQLAAWERVQPPSMTRTVTDLANAGLVTRTPGTADRRQSFVTITEAGRTILRADRRRRDAWLAQRLAAISDLDSVEVRQVIKVLEAINR